jgi:hypothetical protein
MIDAKLFVDPASLATGPEWDLIRSAAADTRPKNSAPAVRSNDDKESAPPKLEIMAAKYGNLILTHGTLCLRSYQQT